MSKKVKYFVTLSLSLLLSASNVFAENTYAENAGKWFLDGIFWIVLVAGIFGTAMAAIRRNMLSALGIGVTTAILLVIIKDYSILVNLGNALKGIIGL